MTKKELKNAVRGFKDIYGSDAKKAKSLGYQRMHYQLDDDGPWFYVEGDLFEAFAKDEKDRTLKERLMVNRYVSHIVGTYLEVVEC